MKLYNLTLKQNKMVAAIINDLTAPYKAHMYTHKYETDVNRGINEVRQRALRRGILLDEDDWEIPVKDIKAIIRSKYGQTS